METEAPASSSQEARPVPQEAQPMEESRPVRLAEELIDPSTPQVTKERRIGSKAGSPGYTLGGKAINVVQTFMIAMMHVSVAAVQGVYYGHRSGMPLDARLVEIGRAKERALMEELGVFKRVPRSEARGKKVRAQWLDDERTDESGQPAVRSRLVAMEVAWESRSDCFVGTPCLACVRLVLAFASLWTDRALAKMIAIHDISVAFFHALLDGDIWVDPPASEGEPKEVVWQLLRALNGTRRAAFLFQRYLIDSLVFMGFTRVKVAAQFFAHEKGMVIAVHGDDIMAAGTPSSLDWLDEGLKQFFMLKVVARVGPDWLGGVPECRFTKRWATWTGSGYQWEADNKHVDSVIGYDGHADRQAPARQIAPGSNHVGKSNRNSADLLDENARAEYISMAPTAHYLAADRPDIMYTTGVSMGKLSEPTELQRLQLQRLGSYMRLVPRIVWDYPCSTDFSKEIYCEVDSDWAQDPDTRRSVGGGFAWWGPYLLDAWCGQHHSVSLSSAEAELHEVVNGASHGLFLSNVLAECGYETTVRIGSDSSVAAGISTRLGAGRVR